VDDLALVLQDKRFTAAGQVDYTLSASDRTNGYTGDTLLINGALAPVWQAPKQWVRFRLLNGCNSRTLALRMGSSLPLLQVANEAGLLAAPVARQSVTLGPGERAEVLVDFTDVPSGQELPVYVSSGAGAGAGAGGMGMGGTPAATEVQAMTVRVSLPKQASAMASPPSALPAAPAVVAVPGAANRNFDISRIDFSVPAGSVEVWTFTNSTNMAHPMHVHGVKMSMLTRAGVAPAAYERGLRDTFVVEAMQTVRVAVQTAASASPSPLMFHCHILEHEDTGMMGQFTTI
jgi:FtsP/CotA-like multicopper oxidase with cupredoxin domain